MDEGEVVTVESHRVRAGEEVGLVGRVRQFLSDYAVSQDRALPQADDPFRASRLARARREGHVAQDIDELERRLRRLRRAYPELGDIDVNPLVRSARSYLSFPEDDDVSSVGGECLGARRLETGSPASPWRRGVEGR